MPRPKRCRRVCAYPEYLRFAPEGGEGIPAVSLTLDEFETIRLVDLEGMTHDRCA